MQKIAIVNYNIGNLASVKNALLMLGAHAEIVSDANEIAKFDKLILPGDGAFGSSIESLNKNALSSAIRDFIKSGKYILGICVGMQVLFDKSYEFGEHRGLGLLRGEVSKFSAQNLKIPHMGWNTIEIIRQNTLLKGISSGEYLYFVHSFCVKDSPSTIAKSCYGEEFSAIVAQDSIFGIQSHLEKSSTTGLKILKNFMELA